MPDTDYTMPSNPKFDNLAGRRFSRLLVSAYAGNSPCGMSQWECYCDCGETRIVLAKHLKSGATRSCGCLLRELAAERQRLAGESRRLNADPSLPPNDPRFIDLTGHKYGMLSVLKYAERDKRGSHEWACVCECGTQKVLRGSRMRTGAIRSCGCEQRKGIGARARTHGDSRARLYWIYRGMLQRCGNLANADYGGRGITVCDEWRSSYLAFREWALSHGYSDDLTIERKDVNEGYCPVNCEWIPRSDQAANKRTTVRITAFGETKHLSEWARDPRCAVPEYTLRRRVWEDWDAEIAMTTPQRTVRLLTPQEIPGIRAMISSGMTLRAISQETGSSVSAIEDIKQGRAWADY